MERFGWLRRYISPVFLALLVASFILWYIAKLNDATSRARKTGDI